MGDKKVDRCSVCGDLTDQYDDLKKAYFCSMMCFFKWQETKINNEDDKDRRIKELVELQKECNDIHRKDILKIMGLEGRIAELESNENKLMSEFGQKNRRIEELERELAELKERVHDYDDKILNDIRERDYKARDGIVGQINAQFNERDVHRLLKIIDRIGGRLS